MNSVKSKILASFKNKRINIFLLFLGSAFIILIFTKLSKVYTNTMVFEIEKVNVPEEYIILNDSVNFNITLKTHGFKWLSYYFSKPKIKVDFVKDVHKQDDVFVYTKSRAYLNSTQFDKKVDLLHLEPEQLTFRYGVNSVKKVPIKVNANFKFAPGFDMSSKVTTEPDSVVVVGPNILVANCTFLETDTLELNDIRTDIKEQVRLKLPEKNKDLKFSVENVVLNAKVEKFTEGTLKIPVTFINAPKTLNIKYFPREVTVSYYVSLSHFNSIYRKDFKVVCDYKKSNESQKFLRPELVKSPDVVKNTKIDHQRIEFIITK